MGGRVTHLKHVRARAYRLQIIVPEHRRRVVGAVVTIIFRVRAPHPRGGVVIRIERDIGHDLAFLRREDRVFLLSVSVREEKRRID